MIYDPSNPDRQPFTLRPKKRSLSLAISRFKIKISLNHLGEARIDEQGRLGVYAGRGELALEATIGTPLFPGIEMSWNAGRNETCQLDKYFTHW